MIIIESLGPWILRARGQTPLYRIKEHCVYAVYKLQHPGKLMNHAYIIQNINHVTVIYSNTCMQEFVLNSSCKKGINGGYPIV